MTMYRLYHERVEDETPGKHAVPDDSYSGNLIAWPEGKGIAGHDRSCEESPLFSFFESADGHVMRVDARR